MKRMITPAAILLLSCSVFLVGFKPDHTTHAIKSRAIFQSTDKPLEVVITHVHEGKQVRMRSIHETIAGNRLTFIYHDGSRIVLNFIKPIKVGNYEIHDRTSDLQVMYYPAGGYPVVMYGYTTMYTLKPLTGRIVQLYDNAHEIHISSSSLFSL